jgi:hypothetical protein
MPTFFLPLASGGKEIGKMVILAKLGKVKTVFADLAIFFPKIPLCYKNNFGVQNEVLKRKQTTEGALQQTP